MITRILAASALAILPTLAVAGPSFSVKDIENHFAKGVECPGGGICIPKEDTRAVCVGTDSACAAKNEEIAADIDPGAFDMLITFDLGSARLSEQAKENLREFAKALNGNALGNATFNIDGHTDARGEDLYNMGLSERRAASVVSYLSGLGIERDRLNATGYGEGQPRTADPFEAVNRRVEATIRLR
ncbi:MAG: OmpA family protein [Pseudomonadota bacterium]